jgi:flagellar hook protein FlgE
MLDLYISNKNAIVGMESALRIAISNANNFNTPGYKYTFATFTTMYTEAVSSGTDVTNPIETGSGMTMGSTSTDFSQGNISIGTELDVAITGEGFFILSSSASEFDQNSTNVFSRAGAFQLDSSNTYIVDDFGRKVFGFPIDSNGNITSTVPVPLETKGMTDVEFQEGGTLVANASSDSPTPLYKLALTTFQNKEGLIATSGGAYKNSIASGSKFSPGVAGQALATGSASTYGDIINNSLESSNVDIAKVALDMNLLNRGFAAVQAVIDDVTKILTEIIKKLGG